MADNSPFAGFDWWGRPQRHALPFRREVVVQDPTAEQWQPPAREPAELRKLRRKGDPLMGTEYMEDAAGELGQAAARKDPREIAIQLATLLSGIYAGKNGKRPDSHRVPFKEGPPKGMDYHPNAPGFSPKDLGLLDPAGFYSDLQYKAGLSARKTGTLEQWRRDLVDKAGVKPAEWQQMGLDKRDPKEVWSQEQLLSHAAEHRLWLTEQRYGGPEPPDIGRVAAVGRPEINEEGHHVVTYEEANTGRQYEVINDKDAGNVSVQDLQSGQWVPVKAPMNRQDWNDAATAIREHGEAVARAKVAPADTQGPLKFGRWTMDEADPSNREVVLSHHGKEYRQLQDLQARLKELNGFGPDAVEGDRLRELAHNIRMGMTSEGHFTDAQNYQGHVRYSMGKDAKGQDRLVIGELQSEPDAQIRDAMMRGDSPRDEAKIDELQRRWTALDAQIKETTDKGKALLLGYGDGRMRPPNTGAWHVVRAAENYRDKPGVEEMRQGLEKALSDRNLVKAEFENAIKAPRANGLIGSGAMNQALVRKGLIEAARSNVPGVVLEPGNVQNDRYNLSKYVDSLHFSPNARAYVDETGSTGAPMLGTLYGYAPGERTGASVNLAIRDRAHLNQTIGEGLADRLLSQPLTTTSDYKGTVQGTPSHRLLDLKGQQIGGQGMIEHYGDPDTHQPGIYGNILQNELQRLTEQSKAARRLPGIDVTERKAIAAEPGAAPRETTHLRSYDAATDPPYQRQPGDSDRYVREQLADQEAARRAGVTATYAQPMHSYPLDERQRTEILKGMPYFKIAPGIAGAGLVAEMLNRQFRDDEPDLNPFGP